jgi:glycosyltransferase involved in cell wall biosynthesis
MQDKLLVALCTNSFDHVSNGPAKFARLMYHHPNLEVVIFTEDHLDLATPRMVILPGRLFRRLGWLSQFFRAIAYVWYVKRWERRRNTHFAVVLFNHLLHSFPASWFFKGRTIGMLNDDNNVLAQSNSLVLSFVGIKRRIFQKYEALALRSADLVVLNSHYLRKTVESQFPKIRERCQVLYKTHGIITQPNANVVFREEEPIVLFAKSDFQRGGLKTLLDAITLLEFPLTLWVVGPTKEQVENVLGNQSHRVHFFGPQPQEKVHELMQRASLLCVPSHHEALGVANLEAMVLGLPVVSTRVGGIPEVVIDGETGWLVEPNNSAALAKAIEEVVSNSNERKKRIMLAQSRALGFFSVEKLYNESFRLVKEVHEKGH